MKGPKSGQFFYPQSDRFGAQAKIEKGATVNFRQPILSFPDLSAWNLKVGIPEAMIDKVEIGQEAVATLDVGIIYCRVSLVTNNVHSTI